MAFEHILRHPGGGGAGRGERKNFAPVLTIIDGYQSFIDQYKHDPDYAGHVEIYTRIINSLHGRLIDDPRPGHFAYQSTLGMRDHAGRQLTTKQIPEDDLFSRLSFGSEEAEAKARSQYRERDPDALLHQFDDNEAEAQTIADYFDFKHQESRYKKDVDRLRKGR